MVDNTDILLGNFYEHFPFNENGDHNAVTQSIYFGRDQALHKKGLVRARKYIDKPQTDLLTVQDSDVVFLEIKYKVDELIKKGRVKTSYEMVRLLMMEPLQLRDHLLHSKDWKLGKADIDSLLAEFYYLKLYPQFAIQCIRRHFHPKETGVDCRITLDQDLRYFAFPEDSPNVAPLMGMEGMAKMEVKYAAAFANYAHALIQLIVEKGAIPIDTLQPKVENMYRETVKLYGFPQNPLMRDVQVQSDPLHSVQNIELINEYPDTELEVKLQVFPANAKRLAELVLSHVRSGLFGHLQLLEGKEDISHWTYYFDNYGYESESGLQQAFVIVHHPDKPKFVVKVKSSSTAVGIADNTEVLERPEETVIVNRTYAESDKDTVRAFYESRLGKPTQYIGTNKRTKHYFFLVHSLSQRCYNFSVDQNRFGETEMVQVEIEYKGKLPSSDAPDSKEGVLAEIKEMTDLLQTLPFFQLEPTVLTKFDWIKQNQGIR